MRKLTFSEFEIDLDIMSLTRLGSRVAIGKRTCDALLYLIQHKERYVSRQELHRHIWGSAKISPSTIPMCISEIRKALNDNQSSPQLVTSLRRNGYRFIGEVELSAMTEFPSEAAYEFPFVGRQSTISSLQMAAQSTLTDLRGRTITIVGEAGSGKTRLISEFSQKVSTRADVIVSRAISSDTESPYSIWSSALRAAISRYPKNQHLTDAANRIAEILPEIPRAETDPSTPSPRDHNAFLIEWSEAFKSIVSQRPLVLVLEDIHHADIDSLKLLERVSAEIESVPIVVIATMRPLPTNRQQVSTTARILGRTTSTLISLSPLNLDEITCFIDEFLPDRNEIARYILSKTSGNAFYVSYLAGQINKGSLLNSQDTSTTHTEIGAAGIISKQLNDLPSSCVEILSAAAVIGLSFSPITIARTLNIDVSETVSRLTAAEVARVIIFDGTQYAFRHSILRDLLYCSIDHNFRMQLHRQNAEILSREGTLTTITPASIFDHLFRAYPLTGADEICRAGSFAAAEASSRFAHNEARRILSAALKLASKDPDLSIEVRCDIMIELAKATLYSGDRIGSRETLLIAASLARHINSADRLARCALDLAPDFLSIEVGTYDFDLISLLRESLRILPDNVASLRSQVMSRLSQALNWSHDDRESVESLANAAFELAQSCNDPLATTSSLAALADASTGPDLTDLRINRIRRLQAATLSQADRFSFLVQQTRLIAGLLEKGDFRNVRLENERYRVAAERTGLSQYRWYPISTDSMLACASGDFSLADDHARRYADIAGPEADENFRQTFACQYALREIERDRSEHILSTVEKFAESHGSVFSWSAATAWIQWDCGRFDSARETLRQFSQSDIKKLYREPGGTIGLAALAETAAHLGDRTVVTFLYELISPISSRFATAGYGVAYFGSLARYASILANSLKLADQAINHALMAVREEKRLRAPSWRILAELELSRAYGLKNGEGTIRHQSITFPKGLDLPRAERVFQSLSWQGKIRP